MGSGVYMTYTFYMDWHLRSCSKKRWSSPLYLSRSLVFFGSKYQPLYGEIVDITTNVDTKSKLIFSYNGYFVTVEIVIYATQLLTA